MKLNLNHNTVIRETLTDGFLRYFQESLVPQLAAKYGEALRAVEMYENHLEKQLGFGGEWYYPLSLLTDTGAITQWVAWEFPKNGAFYEMNPYAYASSAPLAFRLVDEVPEQCLDAVGAYTPTAPTDALPFSVGVVTGNVRMLVGKYSQSFIDALTVALTREVETAHKVRGLANSGIRLEMLFAPNTYMEHTCEGVTYRRLAISEDGARVSKDFWVRWQRAEGSEPVTVSDEIREGEVLFFIGEDVPQKVREKEYRYLLRQNAEKYRSAMGRKTVTEWRELLKKAVKRGTLERADEPVQAPAAPIVQTTKPIEQTPITYENAEHNETAPIVSEQEPLVSDVAGAQAASDAVSEANACEAQAEESTPVSQEMCEENTVDDDPWLARLKEYAGEENTTAEQTESVPDENTDEFRDAMMRMRSILGIAEDATEPDATAEQVDEEIAEEPATEQIVEELEEEPATEQIVEETEEEPAVQQTFEQEQIATDEAPDFEVEIVEQTEEPIAEIPQKEDSMQRPLFAKPVQENFFEKSCDEPEQATAPSERIAAAKQEQSEAELRRQIRDGVLREIEARERERLAEEARRAVVEKEEREAEMARIAKERMEAEASRRELEELREQTRALSEELRAYTQMCMQIVSTPPVCETVNAEPTPEKTPCPEQSKSEPEQQEICFTLSKTEGEVIAAQAQEENTVESVPISESAEGPSPEQEKPEEAPVNEPAMEERKPYQFTEEELSALLCEHTEQLRRELLEQARRIAREELEAERAAWQKEREALSESEAKAEDDAETEAEVEVASATENEEAYTEVPEDTEPSEESTAENTEKEESEQTPVAHSQSQIEELLLRNRREQEEEERRLALEALIREQEEKLSAMRREEEERRIRAEQLIAEQARLEELARVERERAEEENRRLEEERRRAEELALQSYEKHLIEAKRLEEELEAARRRREQEDLRIAEAEKKIAEQTRLAEEAREEQRLKNEEARRLTEEAERRLIELDAAREESRELAERTEEESRMLQQSLQQQEERLRAETLRREEEERQRIAAEQLAEQRRESPMAQTSSAPATSYNYVSRVVHLYFGRAIDPNVIGQIHRLMSDTIAYFNKTHVSISVRAEIVGPTQLDLNFIRIPKEEEPLLINIVKVLGRSNIGVRRASIDD